MQGQINTNLGNISIDSDVIAAYAGSVALGCTGIVLLKIMKSVWDFM